jgi:hypothetical protein
MTRSEGNRPLVDWYERRDELECGQVFRDQDGVLVKLDRRVPGDGTRWYVASWNPGYRLSETNWAPAGWSYDDSQIEPGDLKERADDPARGETND